MKTILTLVLLFFAATYAGAADRRHYEEFVLKVRTCCEKNDLEGLKKLYYFEGTPGAIIDQEIYAWEQIMTALRSGKAEYFKAEHHELTEYLKQQTSADIKMYYEDLFRPVVMNGTTYMPNLEVVGIVAVWFRMGQSTAGSFKPVGIAPDGSMRYITKKTIPAYKASQPTAPSGRGSP